MPVTQAARKRGAKKASGKLRIGDDWNAINIIALSQTNPLKAVAEFVENSIDANARHVTITRGREKGESYLRIRDDGDGIPVDDEGKPNFRYVATHICDSIKRQLKADGARGIQGEFGIGLLSFWTVGENLTMTTAGCGWQDLPDAHAEGQPQLHAQREAHAPVPGFRHRAHHQAAAPGRAPAQWRQDAVVPGLGAARPHPPFRRAGEGDRPHGAQGIQGRAEAVLRTAAARVPAAATSDGEIYTELYLSEQDAAHTVGLYRSGTRVLANIAELDAFAHEPWTSGFLQGIVDASFLNLTPGTRLGVIQDEAFERLRVELKAVEAALVTIIAEQRRAEDERASRKMLNTIRKAFREALLALPAEEYDWFDLRERRPGRGDGRIHRADEPIPMEDEAGGHPPAETAGGQKQFFEYAGPLFSVRVSPQSSVVPVNESRTYRAVARDRSRIAVEHDVRFEWRIAEGEGVLENERPEIVTFTAPAQPGLTRLAVTATQGENACEGEGIVTVTDSLLPDMKQPPDSRQGLPGYTFRKAPGELWRSRYDAEQNVIVINNGHRDFVFASRNRSLKLRYICRLFAKEMVQKNFPGYSPDELLERMIELSLYTEENLR